MNKVVQPRPPAGSAPPPRGGRPAFHRNVTRHQREVRLHRLIVGAVALAVLIVLVVPAFGYYREVLTKGSQPVATVNGETISLDMFAKLYGYRQIALDSQLNQMRALSTGQNQSVFQQQIQQLETERTSPDTTVLNDLNDQ